MVGVTSNIAKMATKMSSKSFYIVPSPKRKCFTDTETYIDKNGNISFAFVDFPIIASEQESIKPNKCVTNYLTN